jgi:YD repeat-containing protein
MLSKFSVALGTFLFLSIPAHPQGGNCQPGYHNLSGVSGNADTGGPAGAFWVQDLQSMEQASGTPAVCQYTYHPAYPGNPNGYFWTGECTCTKYQCSSAPPVPPLETAPGKKSCDTEPVCSSPISLASGNTYVEQTDIRIPGLAGGLTLSRTWNSMWPATQTATQAGVFGPNWRSTYEERIFTQGDGTIKYSRSDGSFWSFASLTSGLVYSLIAPANKTTSLVFNSNANQWIVVFKNGEQRVFDGASGSLLGIVDLHGNTTQLSYDSVNRLVTVTDPASRHLYFAYANNSSFLVSTVTSDIGVSVSYAYDSQGRLIQVTEPDQSQFLMSYDGQSLIAAVTDGAGKTLESHTYDGLGRGLTSSRANGVDAVSVSYPH